MDTLLTPDEVACRLMLSRRTVIKWLQQGRLTGVKVGNRWRVHSSKVVDVAAEDAFKNEARTWLEADLVSELPPYDWGPAGPPGVRPVKITAAHPDSKAWPVKP